MSTDPPANRGASARLDGNDRHDSRRPADLRKNDLPLQWQGRPPTQQGPNGLPKVHRTGWGDHAVSRTGGRLHVQRNARMHLRSGEGSDTMALRRRRIVISRSGLSRYRGRRYWTSPGWSDHDLRAATPAAERCPGRDAGPAQSPACRSRARRQWSPLPGVHHPRHRHPGGTLAMPDSGGRRGRTGHNLTANAALAHHSSRLSPKPSRSSARDSRSGSSTPRGCTTRHTTRSLTGPGRAPISSAVATNKQPPGNTRRST